MQAASLKLSWTDNSTNESGFRVERITATGVSVSVGTVGPNITTYTESGLTPGVTYCYVVRAFNSSGYSSPSNRACTTAMDGSSDSVLLPYNGAAYTDYDADLRADYTLYREGNWVIRKSSDNQQITFSLGASAQDVPVQADYDGDGVTDAAVYNSGTGDWYIVQSTAGYRTHAKFGGSGFVAVPGDYDGDGSTDVAVYQKSTGHWFYIGSTTGFRQHLSFGGAGYVPVPGDYDGDGVTDTAVYQQSTGHWFMKQSTGGLRIHARFGGSGYLPVPADYDGDGTTDTAVYQQSAGHWFIDQSSAGFWIQPRFGGTGYIPISTDYDGDGAVDIAVYQRSTGNWFIDRTTAGYLVYRSFGGSNFLPALPQVTILKSLGLI